jgi:hypothetical protein
MNRSGSRSARGWLGQRRYRRSRTATGGERAKEKDEDQDRQAESSGESF